MAEGMLVQKGAGLSDVLVLSPDFDHLWDGIPIDISGFEDYRFLMLSDDIEPTSRRVGTVLYHDRENAVLYGVGGRDNNDFYVSSVENLPELNGTRVEGYNNVTLTVDQDAKTLAVKCTGSGMAPRVVIVK